MRSKLILSLCSLFACLLPLASEAYFQQWNPDPVARGLADAGTARSGSLAFVLANPAALADLSFFEARGSYGRLFWGLSDGSILGEQSLGVAMPLGGGGLALSWQGRGLQDGLGEYRTSLTYGLKVSGFLLSSIGASVNWLALSHPRTTWTHNNPALTTHSPYAIGFDLGVTAEPSPGLTLGLSALNLNQPSLSFVDESVPTPAVLRLGLAGAIEGWIVSFDQIWRAPLFTSALGIERLWNLAFTTRSGIRTGVAPETGLSVLDANIGASVKWPTEWGVLAFDYAFSWPFSGGAGTAGTHRIGLAVTKSLFPSPQPSPTGGEGGPPLPELRQIHLLPFPPKLLSLELEAAAERDKVMADLNNRPDDPVLTHRAAFLQAVTGRSQDALALYQQLLTLDPRWERVAVHASHKIRYDAPHPSPLPQGERVAEDWVRGLLDGYRLAVTASPSPQPSPIKGEGSHFFPAPHEAWLAYGFLLAQTGRYPEALVAYRHWLEDQDSQGLDPRTHGGALLNLIHCAIEAKELSFAKKQLARFTLSGVEGLQSVPVSEMTGRLALAAGEPFDSAQGGPDAAIGAFTQADALAPTTARTGYHLGVALYRVRQFDEAFRMFKDAEEKSRDQPDHALFANALTICQVEAIAHYFKEGDKLQDNWLMQDAKTAYAKIFRFIPDHPETAAKIRRLEERILEHVRDYSRRAKEKAEKAEFEDALFDWLTVLKADPAHTEAQEEISRLSKHMFTLVKKRLEDGQLRVAYRILKALELAPDAKVAAVAEKQRLVHDLVIKAEKAEEIEQFPQAKKEWTMALDLEPQHTQALSALPRLSAMARERASAFLTRAKDAVAQKDFIAAGASIGMAEARDPDLPGLAEFKQQMYQVSASFIERRLATAQEGIKAGRYPQAKSALDEILKFDPEHPKAKQLLANLTSSRTDRLKRLLDEAKAADAKYEPEKAISTLTELLAAQPGHPEALTLKAAIEGRLDKAKQSVEIVKQLTRRGDKLFGEGDLKQAMQAWKEGLELDYYNAELRRRLADAERESR